MQCSISSQQQALSSRAVVVSIGGEDYKAVSSQQSAVSSQQQALSIWAVVVSIAGADYKAVSGLYYIIARATTGPD